MGNVYVLFFILLISTSCIDSVTGPTVSTVEDGYSPGGQGGLKIQDGAFLFSDNSYAINCFDYISSNDYSSEGSGLYWIDPSVGSPFKTYCDMDHDGGGWTLVGRGRENWSWNNGGLNTSSISIGTGTNAAFTPAYLSAADIDNIIGSTNVSALNDGVRIRRARNTAGTDFQEVIWTLTSQTSWTWLFDTGLPLSSTNIDGVDRGTGDTRDDQNGGNTELRVFTWGWSGHGSNSGFSYGSSQSFGSSDNSSFCYERTNENHCIPYSEVYLRN